ncbi:MAG: protein kinase, partial [Planctomycetes bacterium]|nr:protein kinase [Planctomycetota bacterium]
LAYAKSKNLDHCDLKPDNIMFSESGMAKIADLGIARHTSEQQTQQKEVLGSPHYMAPEQAMGKPVDHRADLYALGCTMFRMLAGRTPFSGTSAREVMKKQVMEEHPDILKFAPDISPELADVIDALMEKNPDKRIQSANELIAMLEKIDRGEVGPRKPQPGAPGRRPTTNVRRASNTLSGPAVTLRNTKISPVTTGAHAIGGARSRRGGGNGSLVSFAIFLAIVAVAALFVYRMAIDYKPKTALGQARSLSKYAAEAHKGGELEKARLNWDKALQLLADAGEASDPLLREEIETLRVDMEKQVEAVKKQEDAELERDRVNGMFDTAWKAYAKKRDARGKHKPSKEALLQELARMEQQFAGHPDKLKEIRLEKDIIGRQ